MRACPPDINGFCGEIRIKPEMERVNSEKYAQTLALSVLTAMSGISFMATHDKVAGAVFAATAACLFFRNEINELLSK